MGSKSGSSKSVGKSLVKSVEKMLPKGVDLTTLVLVLVVLGIAYFIMTNMDADKVEGLALTGSLSASDYYCEDGNDVQTCNDDDAGDESNTQCGSAGDIYCGDSTNGYTSPSERIPSGEDCLAGQCAADLTCVDSQGPDNAPVTGGNQGVCGTIVSDPIITEQETTDWSTACPSNSPVAQIPDISGKKICTGGVACSNIVDDETCESLAECKLLACNEIGDDNPLFTMGGTTQDMFKRCIQKAEPGYDINFDKQVGQLPIKTGGPGEGAAYIPVCDRNLISALGYAESEGGLSGGKSGISNRMDEKIKDVYKQCYERWNDFHNGNTDSDEYAAWQANGGKPILSYNANGLSCVNGLGRVEEIVDPIVNRLIVSSSCPSPDGGRDPIGVAGLCTEERLESEITSVGFNDGELNAAESLLKDMVTNLGFGPQANECNNDVVAANNKTRCGSYFVTNFVSDNIGNLSDTFIRNVSNLRDSVISGEKPSIVS